MTSHQPRLWWGSRRWGQGGRIIGGGDQCRRNQTRARLVQGVDGKGSCGGAWVGFAVPGPRSPTGKPPRCPLAEAEAVASASGRGGGGALRLRRRRCVVAEKPWRVILTRPLLIVWEIRLRNARFGRPGKSSSLECLLLWRDHDHDHYYHHYHHQHYWYSAAAAAAAAAAVAAAPPVARRLTCKMLS